MERKVEEVLAARAMHVDSAAREAPVPAISEQVQRRLDALEQRMYVWFFGLAIWSALLLYAHCCLVLERPKRTPSLTG